MGKKNSESAAQKLFAAHLEGYAFHGEIPFTIIFQLFGKTVKRKAKVVFSHTPEGEFYDLEAKGLVTNDAFRGTYHLEVLAVRSRGDYPKVPPHWVEMGDLAQDDVLSREAYDAIMDAIDAWVAREDKKRRKAAGLK
jgi:hypothetical protein